jgi:hypothetical protein
MAIWYNLWPFGMVCGHLLYFSQFCMLGPRQIWQPWSKATTNIHSVNRQFSERNLEILSKKRGLLLHFNHAKFPKILFSIYLSVLILDYFCEKLRIHTFCEMCS